MKPYPAPTIHPARCSLPVLLSVPHSGRDYPADVLANAARGKSSLEALEDPLVDRLAWRAIANGIGAVIQQVPRAVIDCNRDEDELDPAAICGLEQVEMSPRARHGLGLVPSRTHRHGALWRRQIDRAELDLRLDQVHRPYHQALAEPLAEIRSRCGEALLLDCHSMPSRRHGQAEVVIGDRHGSSSAAWLTQEALRIVRGHGLKAALNDPYAGGAIVGRHGRPQDGFHALQLEIDRASYLNGDGRTAGSGFDRIATLIEALAAGLGEALLARNLRDAAE